MNRCQSYKKSKKKSEWNIVTPHSNPELGCKWVWFVATTFSAVSAVSVPSTAEWRHAALGAASWSDHPTAAILAWSSWPEKSNVSVKYYKQPESLNKTNSENRDKSC